MRPEYELNRVRVYNVGGFATNAEILDDFLAVNERLAQAGIWMPAGPPTIIEVAAPEYLANGLSPNLNEEEGDLYEQYGTQTQDDIVVFYINGFEDGGTGISTGSRGSGKSHNNVIIAASNPSQNRFTLVHEIVHVLGVGNHQFDKQSLMHEAALGVDDVARKRRFSALERRVITDIANIPLLSGMKFPKHLLDVPTGS